MNKTSYQERLKVGRRKKSCWVGRLKLKTSNPTRQQTKVFFQKDRRCRQFSVQKISRTVVAMESGHTINILFSGCRCRLANTRGFFMVVLFWTSWKLEAERSIYPGCDVEYQPASQSFWLKALDFVFVCLVHPFCVPRSLRFIHF